MTWLGCTRNLLLPTATFFSASFSFLKDLFSFSRSAILCSSSLITATSTAATCFCSIVGLPRLPEVVDVAVVVVVDVHGLGSHARLCCRWLRFDLLLLDDCSVEFFLRLYSTCSPSAYFVDLVPFTNLAIISGVDKSNIH